MKEINTKKEIQFDFEPEVHLEDQRKKERRNEQCEGFTYISTVGWICRREIVRRKDFVRS